MVITRHSSNEELMDLQLASDRQALEPTLAAFADRACAVAGRPDSFWQQQHAEIRRRIAQSENSSRRAPLHLAWASALALVLIATMLLSSGPTPAPSPAATAGTSDADQQLLMAVEQVVQSSVPASLEPASLLTEEMGQAVQTSSPVRPKEMTNEN
jgi:hypothetical protein